MVENSLVICDIVEVKYCRTVNLRKKKWHKDRMQGSEEGRRKERDGGKKEGKKKTFKLNFALMPGDKNTCLLGFWAGMISQVQKPFLGTVS